MGLVSKQSSSNAKDPNKTVKAGTSLGVNAHYFNWISVQFPGAEGESCWPKQTTLLPYDVADQVVGVWKYKETLSRQIAGVAQGGGSLWGHQVLSWTQSHHKEHLKTGETTLMKLEKNSWCLRQQNAIKLCFQLTLCSFLKPQHYGLLFRDDWVTAASIRYPAGQVRSDRRRPWLYLEVKVFSSGLEPRPPWCSYPEDWF